MGHERRGRCDSRLERGGEHERLERRARLALTLRCQVELAVVVVAAADHRQHRTGVRVECDERRSRPDRRRQLLRDRLACELLQSEVDRRRHAQVGAVHIPRATRSHELVGDVVREVGRGRALRRRQADVLRLRHRRLDRARVLLRGDVVLVEHLPEHQVPTGARELRMSHRVPQGRVLGDTGEQRRLGQGDVRRVGAVSEVHLAGLLDAVGAVAEVDGVQVRGQDLVLRPLLFEPPGECRLLQLASDGRGAAVDRVLDELLRDRRATLHRPAQEVVPGRAQDRASIDSVVLVEALVLDRDDRLPEQGRDLARREDDSRLRAAEDREHGLAVGCIDVRVRLKARRLRRVERRDLRRDRRQHPVRERREPKCEQHEQEPEESELADAPTFRRASLAAEQRQNAR